MGKMEFIQKYEAGKDSNHDKEDENENENPDTEDELASNDELKTEDEAEESDADIAEDPKPTPDVERLPGWFLRLIVRTLKRIASCQFYESYITQFTDLASKQHYLI